MTEERELIERIIAWGREGVALTAMHSVGMNQRAREVRLHAACSQVVSWLAEFRFYGAFGSSSFSSPEMLAIGRDRDRLSAAVGSYIRRRGGLDKLLLAYDSVMEAVLLRQHEGLANPESPPAGAHHVVVIEDGVVVYSGETTARPEPPVSPSGTGD